MRMILTLMGNHFHRQGEGDYRPPFRSELPVLDFDASASDDSAKAHPGACVIFRSPATRQYLVLRPPEIVGAADPPCGGFRVAHLPAHSDGERPPDAAAGGATAYGIMETGTVILFNVRQDSWEGRDVSHPLNRS